MRVVENHTGTINGFLSNGLPGANEVSLEPLFDRIGHLRRRRAEIDEISRRLAALQPHQWNGAAAEQVLHIR